MCTRNPLYTSLCTHSTPLTTQYSTLSSLHLTLLLTMQETLIFVLLIEIVKYSQSTQLEHLSRIISLLFSLDQETRTLCVDNKRFLLDDGIPTLAYGHKHITTKLVSRWKGPELLIMSADDAKCKGLHPSNPIDPNMMQAGPAKMSYWNARS